jgi:spore coat protein U-like protein
MNKYIRPVLAGFAMLTISLPASQAADISNTFAVTVSLTSQCRAKDSGTKTLAFGTYTAFQTGAQSATGINIEFECTRGFAPTSVAFDTTNGTAIGGGVLAGLNYDIDFAAAVVTAGTAATSAAASIGTADLRSYAITGTMPANQAGATATGEQSHNRMLIVTY